VKVSLAMVLLGAVDEVQPALQVGEVAAVQLLAVDGEANVPVALRAAVLERDVVGAGSVEDIPAGVVGVGGGVVDDHVVGVHPRRRESA
jgi:hypothetical protein